MTLRGYELWEAVWWEMDPAVRDYLRRWWLANEYPKERKAVRLPRDDTRELKAQSLACLIEAYIEMRPYVGTEP
jgi:hypothetical protein